jgi:mono/diheme cytochrome c family protein
VKRTLIAAVVALIACAAALYSNATGSKTSADKKALLAHGEYIVKNVGMCGDCHTPMNEKGEYVQDKWLQGTKLPFGPLVPMPIWADTSVNIAGLPGWDHAQAVKLLMTGLAPNGQPPRPPMPQYHMNKTDAEAVVAYLVSLKK